MPSLNARLVFVLTFSSEPGREKNDHYLSNFKGREAMLLGRSSSLMRLYILAHEFFPGYKSREELRMDAIAAAREQLNEESRSGK